MHLARRLHRNAFCAIEKKRIDEYLNFLEDVLKMNSCKCLSVHLSALPRETRHGNLSMQSERNRMETSRTTINQKDRNDEGASGRESAPRHCRRDFLSFKNRRCLAHDAQRFAPLEKALPKRWIVERTFGWLIQPRRLVRDYEAKIIHSESMIYISMMKRMANQVFGIRGDQGNGQRVGIMVLAAR
jgi:hypothetical protein